MFASGGGIGGRSINADDQAGIQSIYGHRDGTGLKPRILSAVNTGGLIHLVCENLTLNSNQVWFTRASANPATGPGAPVKVTGVTSTNGNTELTVLIPGNAGPGDVIVKAGTPGQAGISAPFPFDPQSGPILVPSVTSISTGTVEVLTPAGGETVSLFGTNLTNVYEVTVDGVPVGNGGSFDGAFTVVDDGQVDVEIPLVNNAGMVDLVITAPGGSVTTPVEIVPVASPVLAIDQPDVQEAVGLDFAVSAQPADVVFLLFSPLLGPTVVPGVLDWEIGNGNPGAVFNIKTWSIGPKLWRKQHFGPLSDLTPGVVLHFEGWVFEAANGYGFPSSSTNAVSRTVVP
jgi:hypothetical protein